MPLADLNVEMKIRYQTKTGGKDRPIKTYTAKPGYFAGVPLFNLTSNAPNRIIKIGQLVDVTVKILIKKLTLKGKLHVSWRYFSCVR